MAQKCFASAPGKGFRVTLLCHSRFRGNDGEGAGMTEKGRFRGSDERPHHARKRFLTPFYLPNWATHRVAPTTRPDSRMFPRRGAIHCALLSES